MSAAFAESSTRDSKSRCCIRCAARATCSPPKPLRSSAVPTTLRIALLAGLLALLANLAVIGFIYWRTHDEALSTVRRQVVEQGKVLSDMYRLRGGGAPPRRGAGPRPPRPPPAPGPPPPPPRGPR